MTPTRALLREATAAAHDRLDRTLGALDLATTEGYGRFLLVQSRALPPLERALEASGIALALPDWARRRRRAALASDLEAMGLAALVPLPEPRIGGPAGLWGAAYVLEGSRLGARLLARRAPAGAATAFLRHGEDDGSLWRGFLAALEASAAPRHDPKDAAAGATAAFTLFERAAVADPEETSARYA